MNLFSQLSIENILAKADKFQCVCDGCYKPNFSIYSGGEGSGCNPAVAEPRCGRPESGLDEVVAKKFERYEKMVKAVADKKITGLAVFGERGIGKSKTVIDVLAKTGANVFKVKGTITPLELFNTLSEHRDVNDIVWFDDADSAFKDTTSLNILKAALDSDEPREISWLTSSSKVSEPTFQFKGRIIVTTNIQLDTNEHVAALVDRMHWINLKLTHEEKMHRIEQVAPKMLAHLDDKVAKDVVAWVKENADKIGDNLSLRVIKKVGDLASFDNDWKDLASSFLDESNKVYGKTTSTDISKALEGVPKKTAKAKKEKSSGAKVKVAKTSGNKYVPGSALDTIYKRLQNGKEWNKKDLFSGLTVAAPEGRLGRIIREHEGKYKIHVKGTKVRMEMFQ